MTLDPEDPEREQFWHFCKATVTVGRLTYVMDWIPYIEYVTARLQTKEEVYGVPRYWSTIAGEPVCWPLPTAECEVRYHKDFDHEGWEAWRRYKVRDRALRGDHI